MKRLGAIVAVLVVAMLLVALAIPVSAAPAPVTYLNANFGPPNSTGVNFYRSSGTIKLQSATASVYAKAAGFEADFSASANMDPNETSSGFSSYNVGTVNAGAGSLNGLSVSPRTLLLSGSARLCMNLWFDSDHNGEYFVWDHNQFAGLGGDVYAIGVCNAGGTVTIDQTTLLFLIGSAGGGCNGNFVANLAMINAGGCSLTIPPFTNVARWVGIDIPSSTSGSGKARL